MAHSNGFALFEVVVTLAISAIGLSLLMVAAGAGLANASLAGQTIEATRRAQSRLAELQATASLEPGVRSGDDGGGFSWRTTVSAPVVDRVALAQDGAMLGLYTIEVTIRWRNGDGMKELSLKSKRTGPR
jgi:prepilin-type N-terminal cleavage/methylation domain-containing protein